MQIQEAVDVCVTQKYADFEGDATRSEFWFFQLFVILVDALLSVSVPTLMDVFSLAMFVPLIAVGARRLHDTGRSGWWQLIVLVPVVGLIVLIVMFAQAGRTVPTPTSRVAPPRPN